MKKEKEVFGHWLRLLKYARFEGEVDFTKLTRPLCVCNKRVPTNLNGITFGQLCQLQELKTIGEMFVRVPCILLDVTEVEVLQARTTDVVRLSAWVAQEMKRINEMWEKINRKPKSEEVRAGIDRIRHGLFGIADWYARRMGITDHEEVMQTSWIRVYKCMQMDNENALFAEKLQNIYLNDRKTRRR